MEIIFRILIIVAMQQEAAPLIQELNLVEKQQFDNMLPMRVYTNNKNPEIILVINGIDSLNKVDCVGTQVASISTLMSIKTFNPDIIINFGTAGGFKYKGAQIGDVYIATKVFYHDRRIPLPKTNYYKYGIGGYDCDTIPSIINKMNLKKGILSTGNSLDIQPCDLKIIEENNAVLKDMEAASIVWVSNLYGIPIIVMKSVTDYIDYPEKNNQDFIRNLDLASNNLKVECLKLINLLSTNKK